MAHPANPEVIVGTRVGKEFEVTLLGTAVMVAHYGVITNFEKWWHVEYDDGEAEDYNYHDLCKHLEPEDGGGWDELFSKFIYHPPDMNCTAFLVESKGLTHLPNAAWKIRGSSWNLINVFSNLTYGDYSVVYCPATDFVEEMSLMSRCALVAAHKSVQISSLKKVNQWIQQPARLDAAVAERRRTSGRSTASRSSSSTRGRRNGNAAGQQEGRVLDVYTRQHSDICLHCKESDGQLDKCFSCPKSIHRECARAEEMDRVLKTRRGDRWCCPVCFHKMYPNG